MNEIIDTIYGHMREKEVRVAKSRLKKIKIDNIFQSISKSCWCYGIKDEIIFKNYNMLLIKLTGKKGTIIIKYHRTDKVFIDELERLAKVMESQGVDRGVYITTGEFDSSIKKYCLKSSFRKNVELVDYIKFIRKQLSLFGSAAERINKDNICFMEFIPD
jgi:hypothetical protein